jgi:DNA-binding beta-propeller fold protein YncE
MRRPLLALAILLATPGVGRAQHAPVYVRSFTYAFMCSPRGVAVGPDGSVNVGSDCLNPHVERFDADGNFVAAWGGPGTGPDEFAGIPNGVAIDPAGNVFVTNDNGGDRIQKFSSDGIHLLAVWGGTGTAPGLFRNPRGIAIDGAGFVYVSDATNHRVQKFTNGGVFVMAFGSAGSGPGQFGDISGLTVDPLGRIYVVDSGRAKVLRFSSSGAFQLEWTPSALPVDVGISVFGEVYVVDFNGSVGEFTPNGAPLLSWGGLNGPFRIAVAPSGLIYITEQYNTRVSEFQVPTVVPAARVTFGRLKTLYR